ncbi:hypothetical protein OAH55_02435 [Hellea sp.]|nr:surface-adhesin E family protein [Hellea sp.]MDB4844387.1 hypothetical protein [Hellea sp.]
MKHLTLILTLLFSTLMFASPAYADWESIGVSVDGNTIYVDFDRIRKNGSYVYWWELTDFVKPKKNGTLSIKQYEQGDCEVFGIKGLSGMYYKQPMGEGSGELYSPSNPEWIYPSPNSAAETILKQVCKFAETL